MIKKGFVFIEEIKHQVVFKEPAEKSERRDMKELDVVQKLLWEIRFFEENINYLLRDPKLEGISSIRNMKLGLKQKEKFYDGLMEIDVHKDCRSGIWYLFKSYAEDIKKWGLSELIKSIRKALPDGIKLEEEECKNAI